ncbi:MAG: DNA repair protein RecN [Bacillota bacterium]|nr:DNA repair protein RecN [Bacillota bacterium]
MLQQLEIHNVALIDCVNIEFGEGLNIMTGETGAGKSIIIDSINAILGVRVSKDIIRTGREKASVEAVFQLDRDKLSMILEPLGMEPDEDGTLILSREFTITGKNTCRINGKLATVSMLKEVSQHIIDMHGQYDNQSLLRTSSHIELLDSFGGSRLISARKEYNSLLAKYRELKTKLIELSGNSQDRERKIDILKFQIDEIKKASLKPGEEEELNKQRVLNSSAEKIIDALSNTYEILFSGNNIKNSANDNINQALKELNGIARLDEKYGSLSGKLEEIMYQLGDIIEEVRNERDEVEYDPALLERIEERLDLIYRLKKKYGNSIDEVISYCKKTEEELNEVLQSEEKAKELEKQLLELDETLLEKARFLHNERNNAALILEDKIGSQLNELEMKNSKFKVNMIFNDNTNEKGERQYTSTGLSEVEFLISPNAGEILKPLSKIASGGEMSRIMLAIKTILADVDSVPVLIFDEIDIGISGIAAQKVGEKLSFISRSHQVICVTHLAQIGCMADNHYLIEKNSTQDSTETHVKKLKGNEIKSEIARIIGGTNISEITLKHAEEMLVNAGSFKTNLS